MVNAAIVFQQTSCVIPQAILLYRGRQKVLPARHFNLGKLGAAINATAVTWVVFLDIIYCFPIALPVTPQNMSYVSVVSTGLVGFVAILWFLTKRKTFKGPKIDMDLLEFRRQAALVSDGIVDGRSGSVFSRKGSVDVHLRNSVDKGTPIDSKM